MITEKPQDVEIHDKMVLVLQDQVKHLVKHSKNCFNGNISIVERVLDAGLHANIILL